MSEFGDLFGWEPLPRASATCLQLPGAGQLADNVALGRLTGLCPDGGKPATFEHAPTPRPEREFQQAESYLLRTALRRWAVDKRIGICGTRVFGDPSIVTKEYEDLSRCSHWKGVINCNRSGCPSCAAKKALNFCQRVKRTLRAGGLWQHLALTIPHSPGDSWELVYDRLLDGVHALTKGKVGEVVMPLVKATIRSTESPWSMRSGWHVHFHILWKLERPLLEAEKQLVREQWASSTGASVERGAWFGRLFECDSVEDANDAALYVSKLAHEMAGFNKSSHPEHWTLAEIFQHAALGNMHYVRLVQEYQGQTKGRRLYQFDKRAKEICSEAPELPETVVLREWHTSVDRAEFSGLSRAERSGRSLMAVYLPLEVANRARGDPAHNIGQAITDLLQAFDADVHAPAVTSA